MRICDVKGCGEPADPVPVPGGPNFDRETAYSHADLCPAHRRMLGHVADAFLHQVPEMLAAIKALEIDDDPEIPF